MDIANNSHDLPSGIDFSDSRLKLEAFAQRVFVRKVLVCEGFIDDDHAGRTGLVATVKCPPLQEGDSCCLKISSRAEIHTHRMKAFLLLWLVTDRERGFGAVPASG